MKHSAIQHRTSRRDFLRVGALTPFGMGLAHLLSVAANAEPAAGAKAKACILLWLDGGPSHLETFDPKPDAPREVRGPFGAIASRVPGLRFSELLPKTAGIADKMTVVRSMTSPLGEHGLANRYLLTGYPPSLAVEYPGFGAVVAHERGGEHLLPPNVAVPAASAGNAAGFLGGAYEPFATGGDPAKPDFRVRDLELYPGVTMDRIERRREFLRRFDRWQMQREQSERSRPFEQAFRLIASPEAKQAFDLTKETAATRARYGPRTFGQSCLLARRLVERGVPFVTVNYAGWDTHDDLIVRLRDGYAGAVEGVGMIPTFDLGFAALVRDLEERGLLEETLVVAMGEFGRTPKMNALGGRDHWPRVFSAVLAGGGAPQGAVVGSSDRWGESPSERPITPADLARTIYTLLGVDANKELHTPDGRPIRINQEGKLIGEICAS